MFSIESNGKNIAELHRQIRDMRKSMVHLRGDLIEVKKKVTDSVECDCGAFESDEVNMPVYRTYEDRQYRRQRMHNLGRAPEEVTSCDGTNGKVFGFPGGGGNFPRSLSNFPGQIELKFRNDDEMICIGFDSRSALRKLLTHHLEQYRIKHGYCEIKFTYEESIYEKLAYRIMSDGRSFEVHLTYRDTSIAFNKVKTVVTNLDVVYLKTWKE